MTYNKKEEINDRIERRLDYLTLIMSVLTPISIMLLLASYKSILIK
jgi:hypothetical protein